MNESILEISELNSTNADELKIFMVKDGSLYEGTINITKRYVTSSRIKGLMDNIVIDKNTGNRGLSKDILIDEKVIGLRVGNCDDMRLHRMGSGVSSKFDNSVGQADRSGVTAAFSNLDFLYITKSNSKNEFLFVNDYKGNPCNNNEMPSALKKLIKTKPNILNTES